MVVSETIAEARAQVAAARAAGRSIGVVPTMGALHAGHGQLIEQARAECAFVVATIFVNPTQFNQTADFEKYPRTFEADLAVCRNAGADLVFAPAAGEMYPERGFTAVEVGKLGDHLCGAFRPGHFRGVATVVAKLFLITQPDRAYFGEKDAQQLAIIERMTRDLNFPVDIVPVPTVREADGLAMSSRNLRLTAEERAAAPVLYRALQLIRERVNQGGSLAEAREAAAALIASADPAPRVEYLELVDLDTFTPQASVMMPSRVAIAAWLGEVRLIDNVRV
jgi:pantoate--beta-alanine ligase